jgi:hypothetical protein
MKSISIATVLLSITLALSGCKHRKQEPIPGPRADRPAAEALQTPSPSTAPGSPATAAEHPDAQRHGASGIFWFQGTLEEAFSTTCARCTTLLWHEAFER